MPATSNRTTSAGPTDPTAATLMRIRADAVRRASKLLHGDTTAAADVVDEVLARVWERAASRGEEYGRGYVLRCVDNAVLDRWRARSRREARWHLVATPPSIPTPEGEAVDRVEAQRLLDRLPPHQRALLELRYLADLPQAQIATRLDVALGTVKSGTARALLRVRELEDAAAPPLALAAP